MEKFSKQIDQTAVVTVPQPTDMDASIEYFQPTILTPRPSSPISNTSINQTTAESQVGSAVGVVERCDSRKRRRSANGHLNLQTYVTGTGTKTHHFYGSTSEFVFLDSVSEYVQQLGYEVPSPGNLWRSSTDTAQSHLVDTQPKSNLAAELRSQLPSQNLGAKLIEVYAQHVQAHTPMLYWPTILIKFQRIYTRSPLHYEESQMAADFCILMMVFAVGSQLSDIVELGHDSGQQMKKGWTFFESARRFHRLIKSTYTLDDAIITLLMSIYLLGASLPSPCWVMAGTTSRIVQDLGLHKRPSPHQLFNVEIESRNRLFWGAYMVDRIVALAFGRPVLLLDEDCDVDLPGKVDEKGVTAPQSLHFFQTSISVVSLLDPIIQLDVIPGNEGHDVEAMMKIDTQLLACWYKYPHDLGNDDADGSIEPSILKIIFIAQQARLALFRHFTNSDLNHALRNACLKKSVEISKLTAKIMLKVAKKHNWENGFAHRCNDMVYNHIFRASIVLLLEHRLRTSSSNLAKAQVRGAVQNQYINILWRALRAAAEARLSAAKSLELLQVFANTLNFDPSLTEEIPNQCAPENLPNSMAQPELDLQSQTRYPAPDLSVDSNLEIFDDLNPGVMCQTQSAQGPSLVINSPEKATKIHSFSQTHEAVTADPTPIDIEKLPSPSHCSVWSDDMDWAMFHEVLNHDSIFGMYAGGVNGNGTVDF